MIRVLALVLAAATATVDVLSCVGASAGEWPAKPVRLVVPFAAGGAADTMGRLHAEALTAAFGKQFYVENRGGGGGLVGTEAVARAEPDGLTLMVSGIPTHVLGPAMNKNVGFDPMRDFTHIAYFGGTPNVLVAHPSLGVTTYRDFLALARAADGIEYVSAGFGTMGNWIAEFLAAKEKIKLVHVAYKGGAQAVLDLVAGHVRSACSPGRSWPSMFAPAGSSRSPPPPGSGCPTVRMCRRCANSAMPISWRRVGIRSRDRRGLLPTSWKAPTARSLRPWSGRK